MVHDSILTVPELFIDVEWMKHRHLIDKLLESNDCISIDFRECRWINPQPLLNLFLVLSRHLALGNKILLQLPDRNYSESKFLIRFLFESGFIANLKDSVPDHKSADDFINLIFHETKQKYTNIINKQEIFDKLSQSPRVQNYETVVPFTFINVSDINNRGDAFSCSNAVYKKCMESDQTDLLNIPFDLKFQLDTFLRAILPELIDNVRIHKTNPSNKCLGLYLRLNKGKYVDYSSYYNFFQGKYKQSALERITAHLFNAYTIQAYVSDVGMTIQQTWTDGWHRKNANNRKRIPRLPRDANTQGKQGIRVDGKNGDQLILKGVFSQNASSLSKAERIKEGLPVNLTGLHSLTKALAGSDWYFSVNSGRNHVVVYSEYSKIENKRIFTNVEIKPEGQFEQSRGVHYQFRISSQHFLDKDKWFSSIPNNSVLNNAKWFNKVSRAKYSELVFVNDYELPNSISNHSLVICRAAFVPEKNLLHDFLVDIKEKQINLIIAEQSSYISTRLRILTDLLINQEYELNHLMVPIISSDYHVSIAYKANNRSQKSLPRLAKSFIIPTAKIQGKTPWWRNTSSIIKSVIDVFNYCRHHDSEMFWEFALSDELSFLKETVKWTQKRTLTCGYLSISAILRNSKIKEMVLRRIYSTISLLKGSTIYPLSSNLESLASEISNRLSEEKADSANIVYLGSVWVSGGELSKHLNDSQRTVVLPILLYPQINIVDEHTNFVPVKQPNIRVLEWLDIGSSIIKESSTQRIGHSEYVTQKPRESLEIISEESPQEYYNTWQNYELVNIGHYSYSDHHYFVWISLKSFLHSNTPDSLKMIEYFASKIEELQPCAILYAAHEVSEIFADKLSHRLESVKNSEELSKRFFPVSPGSFKSYIGIKEFDEALMTTPSQVEIPKSNILFLDDALISGNSNRTVRSHLKKLGFRNIYSFTMLDRCDSKKELSLNHINSSSSKTHIAWWSLMIPSTGNDNNCSICKGIDRLCSIRSNCEVSSISYYLDNCISLWGRSNNLKQFENILQKKHFVDPLKKRLGNLKKKDILLKNSHAATTWVFDMMNRLDYYNYIFERDNQDFEENMAEIYSGIIFSAWDKLSVNQQYATIRNIVKVMLREERESAISLILVAICSLDISSIRYCHSMIKYEIESEGFPNFSIACCYYVIAFLCQQDNINIFSDSIQTIEKNKTGYSLDRYRSAISYLGIFNGIISNKLPAMVFEIIGPSGRILRHHKIYERLANIKNMLKSNNGPMEIYLEKLHELSLYIDPIIKLFREKAYLFMFYGTNEKITEMFADYEKLLSNNSDSLDRFNPDVCFQTIHKLHRFLGVDIYGKPNIRAVLSKYYCHYIPYIIRKAILKEPGKYNIKDIYVKPPLNNEEKQLLNNTLQHDKYLLEKRFKLLGKLNTRDVVVFDSVTIYKLIDDMLSNIRHITEKIKIGTSNFKMLISISFPILEERKYVEVCFSNKASKPNGNKANGKSWPSIVKTMKENDGNATFNYNEKTKVLNQTLVFPVTYTKEKLD